MSAKQAAKTAQPSREVVAEAAAWITRLHGSQRSPEVEAGLRRWLASDEEHARAFESMTELWETMPAMPLAELPRVTTWRRPDRPRTWMRAAAVLVACVAVGLAAYHFLSDPSYTTDIGEQRFVNLDDGTRVSLNSNTRMTVHYIKTERRIELRQGEAFFEVAPHAQRPFIVIAGDHRVRAVGTSFAVRHQGDRIAVTLVEGKVAVTPQDTSIPVMLAPGERLTFAKSAVPKIDKPRMEAVTAWRRGEVILDETSLADAVTEMNRYDKTPLVIDDPAIAALPVSGIYRTGDSPGFARIVARMYDLAVGEEDGRIHLRY